MRTISFSPFRWFLAIILSLLALCPLAHCASATWSKTADAEQLVLRFDFRLPGTKPKKSNSALILPVRWSFWQRERKPKPVDFSSSALLKGLAVTQDGIQINTRSANFTFSATPKPQTKELVLVFRSPEITEALAPPAPTNATNASHNTPPLTTTQAEPRPPSTVNATESDAATAVLRARIVPARIDNATSATNTPDSSIPAGNATSPRSSNATFALRTKISRAEQPTPSAHQEHGLPGNTFRIRQPISRDNATSGLNASDMAILDTNNASSNTPQTSAFNATRPQDNASGVQGYTINGTDLTDQPRTAMRPDMHATNASNAINATFLTNATGENATAGSTNSTLSERDRQKHADYFAAFQDAQASGNVIAAKRAMIPLLRASIPPAMREAVLYGWADLLMRDSHGNPKTNFRAIEEAYLMAMNNDVTSPRMPEVLHNLGYLHLAVNNIPEARAYFGLLRKRYPEDPRVPMIDLYWGQYFAERGDCQRAADHFQFVSQNYPHSDLALPASMGLLKCLLELGYTEKAFEMIGDIERRWPTHYLRDPQFLMSAGFAAMQTNRLDQAKDYFWRYYNIFPKADQRDVALARVGDILVAQGQREGAREVFERILSEYPNKDGALIALMRLAEEGILKPNPRDANSPTAHPERHPEKIYERILRKPNSPLAPIARLKLAMWHFQNKDYPRALADADQFLRDYPKHELTTKAREVGDQALFDWVAQLLQEENFKEITERWTQHGKRFDDREPAQALRLAAATAFLKEKKLDQAVELARPLVFGDLPRTEYSEQGLDLLLSIFVDQRNWTAVLDTAQRVRTWGLPPTRQRQVDYATALAHENLDQHEQAKPLWTRLSTDLALSDDQRAYALYFLARGAMADGDAEQAVILGQEALAALQKTNSDTPKIKETLDMLSRAAESSGRVSDALAWANEYGAFVNEEDGEWAAFTYRKALLLKKNGDTAQWRTHLERIIAKAPTSLYSRMASTELETMRLEQEIGKIR